MHPFDILKLENGAALILTPCPGTKETSIAEAVETFKAAGATAIVTMLPDKEIESLSVSALAGEVRAQGLSWFQLPVEDDSTPEEAFEKAWDVSKMQLMALLDQGKTIAIHCRGGSGRTGLMAAVLLLESGAKWDDTKKDIQQLRPTALTLADHLDYLKKHYSI